MQGVPFEPEGGMIPPGSEYGGEGQFRPPKTGVCYAFIRGECNRGDMCRFNHTNADESFAMVQPPQQFGAPAPTGFCFAFQRGECFRGDMCKYAHIIPPNAGPEFMGFPGGGLNFPPPRKPCFAFQRGECQHGENCRFAHITPDGMLLPSFQNARASRKPCFAFLNTGNCDRGSSCRFSHDPSSLIPPGPGISMPPGPPFPMPPMPMGVCFAFQRGQCQRGDACRYAHVAPGTFPPGGPGPANMASGVYEGNVPGGYGY